MGRRTNARNDEYREHYLEPAFRTSEAIRLSHSVQRVHTLGDGRTAYAVSSFTLVVGAAPNVRRFLGVETLVFSRDVQGVWKIRHAHVTRARDRDSGDVK